MVGVVEFVVQSVLFDCVGIQESCLGFFVGTEEKQSDSSEHTFDNGAISSGHTHSHTYTYIHKKVR